MLGCEGAYQHLSSSAVRELPAIQPGAQKRYLPNIAQVYGFDPAA